MYLYHFCLLLREAYIGIVGDISTSLSQFEVLGLALLLEWYCSYFLVVNHAYNFSVQTLVYFSIRLEIESLLIDSLARATKLVVYSRRFRWYGEGPTFVTLLQYFLHWFHLRGRCYVCDVSSWEGLHRNKRRPHLLIVLPNFFGSFHTGLIWLIVLSESQI